MLHPTIDELTHQKINRYELALATAKCARMVTEEYVKMHEGSGAASGGRDSESHSSAQLTPREIQLRDEKAVSIAISRIYNGECVIVENKPAEEDFSDIENFSKDDLANTFRSGPSSHQ